MPTNIDKKNQPIRVVKLKKLKPISITFILILSVIFVFLIFNFSDLISSVITHKGSIFYPSKIEVYNFNAYAVSLEQFEDKLSAQDYAKKIYARGGAGYVYESGENFVLAACYPTLSQAKEIRENLIELGYNAKIVNLKISAVSKNYNGEDLNLLTESIKLYKTWFERCYLLSISYDRNETNQSQANSVLAQNLSEITAKIQSFQDECRNEKVKNIFLKSLNFLKSKHEETLYDSHSSLNFSANLKRLNIEIILQNKNLNMNINNLKF